MMLGDMGESPRRLASVGGDASPIERADDFYRAQYGHSVGGYAQGDDGETGFDPLRLFYYLLQYRWLVLGMAALSIVAGMIWAPPITLA